MEGAAFGGQPIVERAEVDKALELQLAEIVAHTRAGGILGEVVRRRRQDVFAVRVQPFERNAGLLRQLVIRARVPRLLAVDDRAAEIIQRQVPGVEVRGRMHAKLGREFLRQGGVRGVAVAVVTVEVRPGMRMLERIVDLARQLAVGLRSPSEINHARVAAADPSLQLELEHLRAAIVRFERQDILRRRRCVGRALPARFAEKAALYAEAGRYLLADERSQFLSVLLAETRAHEERARRRVLIVPGHPRAASEAVFLGQRRERVHAVAQVEFPMLVFIRGAVFLALAEEARRLGIGSAEEKIDALPAGLIQRSGPGSSTCDWTP